MAQSEIYVLHLDNPPVNALSHALRTRIRDGIAAANAAPEVRAIVLSGTARAFSGGADIAEFGSPAAHAAPSLNELLVDIERNPKPVVAAITGVCLGGGLELALASHARVAHPEAQIALPEVKLGLLPGAGGTQRLPRAIGPERAARMITSGSFHKAAEFAGTGLIQLLSEDTLAAAAAYAAKLATGEVASPRLRDIPLDEATVAAAIGAVDSPRFRAAEKGALAAIRAGAEMDFDAALKEEFRIFTELHDGAESIALRYAFLAERKAGRLSGETPEVVDVRTVGIVGTGTMGRGIAIAVLKAGLPVTMIDTGEAALTAAREAIASTFARDVARQRLSREEADRALAGLGTTLDLHALASADLVIEAIYEDMAAKRALFGRLDAVCKAEALLATNTSMLDVNEIATAVGDPSRVFGLHFFSPAHVMKLVEVVQGGKTSRKALASALAFSRRIGKIAVVAGVTHGFIGNRMLESYLDRAFIMVEEGASPYEIDAALEAWGMAMGPFHMLDLAGNDISFNVRATRREKFPGLDIPPLEALLYRAGRLGQKTAKGWYDYTGNAPRGVASAEVEALLAAHRREVARPPRAHGPGEIVAGLIGALAGEGRKILHEGFARSAEDIDVVYLHGYGFPRHRGGPMHYALANGLPNDPA